MPFLYATPMTHPTQPRAGIYGRQSANKAKSISEQIDAGQDVADQQGWSVAGVYQDGTSASRKARKARDDWPRVLTDIKTGGMDVLILWESSRGDRTPESWFAFLSSCRDNRVKVHVISHDRTYDLSNARDWKTLADDGVNNAYEVEVLSLRVRRGQAGAARKGRPSHGRVPYGYRRVYDPHTGELIGQEVDPALGPIAAEIITRISRAEPVVALARDLKARGIPTPTGGTEWTHTAIRDIATNVAYIGLRRYNGQLHPAIWPALVAEPVFYAAQRVLSDPARVTTLPGRYKHLLSYLATCGPCGASLDFARNRYRCSRAGCVGIRAADMDDFVTRLILGRLSRPDLYASLRKAGEESDREVIDARREAAELVAQLDKWRQSAAAGQTSPESLEVIESTLKVKIRQADRKVERAAIPVALRQIVEPGKDVRTRWEEASVAARRDVVRALAEIKLAPATAPGSRVFEPARLGGSRWAGDQLTWADHWAAAGQPPHSRLS